MKLGILYFTQKPLLNGFSIENDSVLLTDEQIFIGRYQELAALLQQNADIVWITNIPNNFDRYKQSGEIQAFIRLLKGHNAIFKKDLFFDLNSLISLITYNDLNESQWQKFHQILASAISSLMDYHETYDLRDLLTSKPLNFNSTEQLPFIQAEQLSLNLMLSDSPVLCKGRPSQKCIASLCNNAIQVVGQLYPLHKVHDDIEYSEIDLPSDLNQFTDDQFVLIKIENCNNDLVNKLLVNNQGCLTLAVTKSLLKANLLKSSQLLHAVLIKNTEQVQLPVQLSSKLDILSVTKLIFATLLLSSYHLVKSDNEASDQLLILQISQSLWINNILLLQELNHNGFHSYTISTDKVGVELEDPQISDFIRYCYTQFYDIDRGTFHKYQKARQVQHA